MQENPRVGLVLMRSALDSSAGGTQTQKEIDDDAEIIVQRLGEPFSVVGPWTVDSPGTMTACLNQLTSLELDMILLTFQTWADENLLVSLLDAAIDLPLVLWCFLPFRRFPHPAKINEVLRSTGSVSVFNALGTLRNLDAPFLFTWGAVEDPRLIHDLEVAGRAAKVRRALRKARFGLLPSQKTDMQSSMASVERLHEDFGPQVEIIPIQEFRQVAEAVTPEEVQAYLDSLCQKFAADGVPDPLLKDAARSALALGRLAARYRLDVLAVHDSSPVFGEPNPDRPVLYPDFAKAAHPSGVTLYQPEADLGAAAANYILSCLTDSPTMFVEFWFWDETMNQLVGGHSGLQNPALSTAEQGSIHRDFCRGCEGLGVQMHFIARPGRVTIFQLRATPDGWQAIAASGVTLESLPVVEGFPHVLLRLDTPIEHFLNQIASTGAGQHWIIAYGSVLHELEAFCKMENIPLLMLRS